MFQNVAISVCHFFFPSGIFFFYLLSCRGCWIHPWSYNGFFMTVIKSIVLLRVVFLFHSHKLISCLLVATTESQWFTQQFHFRTAQQFTKPVLCRKCRVSCVVVQCKSLRKFFLPKRKIKITKLGNQKLFWQNGSQHYQLNNRIKENHVHFVLHYLKDVSNKNKKLIKPYIIGGKEKE